MAQHGLLCQVLAQVVGRLADLALAGQEHQDVAADAAGPQLVHAFGNGVVEVVVALFLEGGYIKQILPRRPDLKVVVTSATMRVS